MVVTVICKLCDKGAALKVRSPSASTIAADWVRFQRVGHHQSCRGELVVIYNLYDEFLMRGPKAPVTFEALTTLKDEFKRPPKGGGSNG